ncbi:MAG: 2-hydroxyacyl-CoA dehydratase family protein [Proteobacteria bacterium]|nr:2-hydroxyacyl-CoA dehydratase family protein [Pseudomonadota bacterium]
MISEFKERFDKRHDICREIKQGGKKIMACFYGLVPKELVQAAGMLPIQLIENRDPKFDEGSKLLPYLCGMSKNLTGQLYSKIYDYLDGAMVATVCDTNRHVFDIWQYNNILPNLFLVRTPSTNAAVAVDYYKEELKRLAGELEKLSGRKITDEALLESIALFNENRAQFKQFYDLRPKSGVSAEDALYVFASGLTLPVEEHNEMLKRLNASLSPRKGTNGQTRLMLSAVNLNMALDIIKMAAKYDAAIVTDDFIHNSRYGLNTIATDGDPWEALARGYLRTIPAPGIYPFEDRAAYIRDTIKEAKADGMIYLVQLYCDAFAIEYAILKERFDAWNINYLKLEAEDTPSSIEQLNVRVQSFVESLV